MYSLTPTVGLKGYAPPHLRNIQIRAEQGFENAFIFWWRIKMETESTWELI